METKGKYDDYNEDEHDDGNHNGKGKYARRMPARRYGYFRDDEIILLVTQKKTTSDEPMISKKQLQAIGKRILPALNDIKKDAVLSLDPQVEKLWDVANNTSQQVLYMLTYRVENPPEDPLYLTKTIGQFNEQPKNKAIAGLTIVGSSSNWLTSVASNGAGTGGPGGRPSPYNGDPANAPAGFDALITSLTEKNIYGEGRGVDVAILDTAPCAQDLVAAPKEWRWHPLIRTLLGPNGKLHLYPASYAETLRLGNTSLNDHDYIMTDHGLFVAGIIHKIVPQANIHLIEVLNQYGVGDFMSFVRGLMTVLNEIYDPRRKLVINCSWMLEFPRDPLHCRHRNQSDPDAQFEKQVFQFAQNDKATALLLEFLFNQFFSLGCQGIAAAGNDGRKEYGTRVPSRYPAALKNVTGVGALPKTLKIDSNGKYEPSVYSNLADDPEEIGIMTLGGEVGSRKGVLGVYIGEFPEELNPSLWRRFLNWLIRLLGGRVAGPINRTKWAWWAGTSFAAPILTGAVAAVLSSANNITRTQDAISALYKQKIVQGSSLPGGPGATPADEDVIAVTQN